MTNANAKNAALANVSDVWFSYRDLPVLTGASLSIEPGDFCLLVGPNGSGKSTLVKLLLGELAPQRGAVSLFGVAAPTFSSWEKVGYVPQQAPADYEFFPATVYETVNSGLYAQNGPFRFAHKGDKERVHSVLEQLELSHLTDRPIGQLSGDQFQHVLLARALVSRPSLIILDEATSNLDDESASCLTRDVHAIVEGTGKAALLVTHDAARLPKLYNRVARLENGKVRDVAHV